MQDLKGSYVLRVLILIFYIFISIFTFSSLAIESEGFSLGLNLVKGSLLFLLILLSIGKIFNGKVLLYLLFLVLSLLSLDGYVVSLVFLLVLLIFTNDLYGDLKVVKYANRASFLAILCILFGAQVGVFKNVFFYDSLGYGLAIRESLGFYNPNPASLVIFSCIVIALFIKDYTLAIFSSILFLVLLPYLGSRTYLYSIIIFFIIYFFSGISFLRKGIICVFLLFLIIIPIIINYFIASGNWFVFGLDLNSLFSDRLNRIRVLFFENGGLFFFPSLHSNTVDSGLANIVLKLGLFCYYLFIFFVGKYVWKIDNKFFFSLFLTAFFILITENIITGYVLMPIVLFACIMNNKYEIR